MYSVFLYFSPNEIINKMNFSRIKQAGFQILKARKEIVNNRQDWEYVAKPSLETMVDMLNNELPFKVDYSISKTGRNIETVIYSLGSESSDITIDNENGSRLLIKDLGYLAFGLIHNGEVRVIVSKPKIDGLVENKEQYVEIGYLKPIELTNERIFEFFLQFLLMVEKWEKSPPDEPIGFKLPGG
ncbi:hypothetical protein [Runella salmonicolor]|uniref:Uncharacterized protein n=1 Tax=Runella salmonicolor TaxID=2950278 RepID=A0ABT1FTH1_9BACT|nr:hypothetical protein [Runella salmonicolor]MCP1384785.1 hypothetical protein [Runella salmonicolor]